MGIPQVVIVGRPNVGKSSLFNWLVRKRLAIVDRTAGVTRDRMTYLMCHRDRFFELVDTGGMGVEDVDNLTQHVEDQINAAIESAAVILFVVDTRDGPVPLDQEVAKRLRYLDTPMLCVANKADDPKLDSQADEFYRLGRGKLVCTSTLQNRNRDLLLDLIVERLPLVEVGQEQGEAEPTMKVAIVGRRNTGKSTLVNTLAHAERMIVSEVPGTTRDSVDVRFELDGKSFLAIDTPGLRRRKSITTDIDFYSTHRAQRSIRRADVVLLFFDPTQRISKVDKQLSDYIASQYKPCIFVVNKWDLMADGMPTERWVGYLRDTFRTMWYVPIAFITGQTGKNVKALLNHAQMLFKQAHSSGDDRRTESRRSCRFGGESAAACIKTARPKIFYAHASRHRATDDRAVLQRARGVVAALSSLSAGSVSRSAAVFRSADQTLPAKARRHARLGRSFLGIIDSRRGAGVLSTNRRSFLKSMLRPPLAVSRVAVAPSTSPSTLPPMIVGVPKETKRDEYRVGILPVGVEELTRAGHQVLVERGAGVGSGLQDDLYKEQGAQLVDTAQEVFAEAEMILKVKEPLPPELPLIRAGQIVFTYFHFAADRQLTEAFLATGATAVAYETLRDDQGRLPLLTPMSEVAGRMSIQEGAKYLERPQMGRGILLGGVPGVAPAHITILGGGIVGANAAKVAAGFGADICLLDVNMDRLRYLDDIMPANVDVLFSDRHTIREQLAPRRPGDRRRADSRRESAAADRTRRPEADEARQRDHRRGHRSRRLRRHEPADDAQRARVSGR